MDLRTSDRTRFAAPRYVVETLRVWRAGTRAERQQLRLISDVGRRQWTVVHKTGGPRPRVTASAYGGQDDAMTAIGTVMAASGQDWDEISPYSHPWA